MNIAYESSDARRSYNDFTDEEEVFLELGDSSSPDVTLTILDSSTVSDPAASWANQAKTFSVPDDDPLEVTMTNTSGDKKIHLKIKPNGGLPDPKPPI